MAESTDVASLRMRSRRRRKRDGRRRASGCLGQALAHVGVDGGDHLVHARVEEVAGALDGPVGDGDALLLLELVGERRRRRPAAPPGRRAPYRIRPEEGQGARKEKSYWLVGGETEMKPSISGPAHQELHADPGAEGVARHPALRGGRVDRLQPVQRRGRVGQLADALVELALAAADAAEVEPQAGEADAVEGGVEVVATGLFIVPP